MKIKISLCLIVFIFVFANINVQAQVIFSDNFDGFTSGWTPSNPNASSYWYPSGNLSNYEPSPVAAAQRNNSNSWNGWIKFGNNTIEIAPTAGRNGSGALKIGYENTSPMNQIGLIKWLGYPGYNELYIRWYFKFDDQWCWGNGTNGSMVYFKTMRIWQGVDLNNLGGKNPTEVLDFPYSVNFNWQDDNYSTFSPFLFAKFINNTPTAVAECPENNLGPPCNHHTWWNNPQGQLSYWLGALNSSGCFTTTQTWHSIEHRIKLRDGIANQNAIYEIWIDGVKIGAPSAPYNTNPYASTDGGGMSWIVLADNGTGGQYWPSKRYLYIDDFVVSTSPIGILGGDETAPVLSTKTIAANGTTLTLAFNETVSIGAGGNGGWTISPSGGAATLAYSSGSGTSSLVYTISRSIQFNETATVSYTQPTNGVEDAAGNDLASLSNSAVTNSSTQGVDTTPTQFTFTDISNAARSTVYTSNTITVAGINSLAAVSITNGTYSKNGGAYTSNAGTAVLNDTFAVRHTSSGSYSTAVNTVLTIGGVSDTYTTTTLANPGDVTPPVCTITDPTTNTTWPTSSATITVGGSATDGVGVTSISWACPTCTPASGVATCIGCTGLSVTWSQLVALSSGANVFTATATDGVNTHADAITITYTPVVADPPSSIRGINMRGVYRR